MGDALEQPVFEGRPGKLPHWASNLEDNVDKKLLIILRDGRKLMGWLRCLLELQIDIFKHL